MKTSKNLFPALFDDFFTKEVFFNPSIGFKSSAPAMNVKESDNAFTVFLAAPGLKKDLFKLTLDHDLLIISADIKEEKSSKKEKYTRQEFSFGSFKRILKLPLDVVDHEKVNASYVDGILSIEVPKKEEAKVKPSREIEVV